MNLRTFVIPILLDFSHRMKFILCINVSTDWLYDLQGRGEPKCFDVDGMLFWVFLVFDVYRLCITAIGNFGVLLSIFGRIFGNLFLFIHICLGSNMIDSVIFVIDKCLFSRGYQGC